VPTLTFTPPVKNLSADYVTNFGDRTYLSWTSQPLASGNTLVGHIIEKSTDGGATYSTVASNASTATNYTVTGLTQGVSTIFRVTAITTNGNSLPGSVSFRPAVAPGVVRNLLATTTDRSVTLNWLAPVSTGGYPIIGYQIQQTSPTALVYITNTLSTTPSFTISGLTPGTQYNFSVYARTAFGVGAATVASVVPSGPSGPVVLLNASAVDRGQVTINWSEPSNYNGLLTTYSAGREMLTGYRIETSIDPTVASSWTVNQTLTYPTTSYIVSGIPNGRTVWIRVTPTSTRGDGVSSMIPVLPSTAPDAPTQLVSVAGDGSVALSWVAPLGNGGLPIVGYQIEVSTPNSPTNFPSPFIANTGNTTTSFTVLGLNNSSTYGFRIKALSAAGLLSNGATVTSSPIASSGAPSQVSVTPQSRGLRQWPSTERSRAVTVLK
jgi:titin